MGEGILCEIHIYRSRYDAIVPGVLPVTPVVGRTAANVVDHAPEQVHLPPLRVASSSGTSRSRTRVVRVRIPSEPLLQPVGDAEETRPGAGAGAEARPRVGARVQIVGQRQRFAARGGGHVVVSGHCCERFTASSCPGMGNKTMYGDDSQRATNDLFQSEELHIHHHLDLNRYTTVTSEDDDKKDRAV